MGNPVQEVLQRRGKKKGQDIWIKRGVPFFLLLLTYLGLLLELPSRKSELWFPLCVTTIALYAFLRLYKKDQTYTLEFLFSLGILIPGVAQALELPSMRLVYFPLVVSLTVFCRSRTVLLFVVLIPLLDLKYLLLVEKSYRRSIPFVISRCDSWVLFVVCKEGQGHNDGQVIISIKKETIADS